MILSPYFWHRGAHRDRSVIFGTDRYPGLFLCWFLTGLPGVFRWWFWVPNTLCFCGHGSDNDVNEIQALAFIVLLYWHPRLPGKDCPGDSFRLTVQHLIASVGINSTAYLNVIFRTDWCASTVSFSTIICTKMYGFCYPFYRLLLYGIFDVHFCPDFVHEIYEF